MNYYVFINLIVYNFISYSNEMTWDGATFSHRLETLRTLRLGVRPLRSPERERRAGAYRVELRTDLDWIWPLTDMLN